MRRRVRRGRSTERVWSVQQEAQEAELFFRDLMEVARPGRRLRGGGGSLVSLRRDALEAVEVPRLRNPVWNMERDMEPEGLPEDDEEAWSEFDAEFVEPDSSPNGANAPFAPLLSGAGHWPIITSHSQGRIVSYRTLSGTWLGRQGRSFGANRSSGTRYHVGVDLFGRFGDSVVAIEDGRIVRFFPFCCGENKTSWALLVQHANVVVNYGEVVPDSLSSHGLRVGSTVRAGQVIARVGRNPGGSSMIHFETYTTGTTRSHRWMKGHTRPAPVLNPTRLLLQLQEHGLPLPAGGSGTARPTPATTPGTPGTVVHSCRPGEGPPAAVPDPQGRGLHPTVYVGSSRQWSRNPTVGDAQGLLNRFLAGLTEGNFRCGSGVDMAEIQRIRGTLSQDPLTVDCRFGPNTEKATKIFQRCVFPGQSREWDGKIGPKTWTELERLRARPVTPVPTSPPRTATPTPPAQPRSALDVYNRSPSNREAIDESDWYIEDAMTESGFGSASRRARLQADHFLEELIGAPAQRLLMPDESDAGAREAVYPAYAEQQAPRTHPPYLPTGGRNFVPQAGTFNCSPASYTVIPASFLPQPTGNPDAAIDAALTAAGLNASQRRGVTRAGLVPIAREFGEQALTELFARLRWSAADFARPDWSHGADSMLVQRLLIHVPGHFRELARRAPNAREAFMLECLGWLLMASLRDSVAAATRRRWWIPPAPDFVTAVPNPVPPASAEVQRLFTRHLYIDTLMTVGRWNARLNAWRTGLAGRQWQAEVFAARPGLPFYASLVSVPAHVNTAAARASFAAAWTRRLADTDAAHTPHAAGATRVTLAGLQNALSLRRCDNGNPHLPNGTLSRLGLQGLELAYEFPLRVGGTRIRRLNLLQQLHPVYTALFRAIKELGWNDLMFQTSGAGCFRGIKHGAAARVNINGSMVLVNPFNRPDATTVTRINTHFTAAQRAQVIRATRTARRMSEHGLGAAIDVNVPENGQNVAGRAFGGMDPRITAIFEAFHFRWGGCFNRTDPHHFEYCRNACAPAAVPATPAPGAPAGTPGGGAIPAAVGPVIA